MAVVVCTSIVTFGAERSQVSLIHLVKASASGIVKELVYVAGGSYLILAVASTYLFFFRV